MDWGVEAALASIVSGRAVIVSGLIALAHRHLPLPSMAVLPPSRRFVSTTLHRYRVLYFLALLAAVAFFVTEDVANTGHMSWLETFVLVVRGVAMGVFVILAVHAALMLIDDVRTIRLLPAADWDDLTRDDRQRLARFLRLRVIGARVTGIAVFVLLCVTLVGPLSIQLCAAWGVGMAIPFVPMCVGDVAARRLWNSGPAENESEVPGEDGD